MRSRHFIVLSIVGSFCWSSCSDRRPLAGNDVGGGGGHAGTGDQTGGTGGAAGAAAGAAGSIAPTGAGGTSGVGTGGSAPATGTGGAAGQAGRGGGAGGGNGLSVNPSSATFAGILVGAVSGPQTFTLHNETREMTATLAALLGTNAADFVITSNGCGAALQPGASCDVAVAFAPKTRSGTRSASLAVTTPSDAAANVSLSGAALPALSLLAGGLGGVGNLDGTGATARFGSPRAIAGDGAGNLYVGDFNNRTIRKIVLATGVVTTLAGRPGQQGSVDGTGAAARFNGPFGMISDGAGNLYVGDGYTIRKVVTATGAVTTIAGAPGQEGSTDGVGAAARFKGTGGIASDGAGSLYVTDTSNDTIRKFVIATGEVTTIAGKPFYTGSEDGTGDAARFAGPAGIVADGAGNLYVVDTVNCTIRKVVIATGAVTTIAGTAGQYDQADGTGAAARFGYPEGMVGDGAGNLYVADTGNGTIRKVVIATGAVTTIAGSRGSADGTGAAAGFYEPRGIVSDGAGNLYVTDYRNQTIRKVAIGTAAVTTIAGAASQVGSADGAGSAARFAFPHGIVSDGAGNVYVADNISIRKVVVATGAVTTLAGSGSASGSTDGVGPAARFSGAYGIAGDGAGNLFVAETGSNSIRKIVIATAAVTTLAGAPGELYPSNVDGTGAAARFNGPKGIAADGAGNVFVADTGNNTIRKLVVATGAVTTFAGGGTGATTDGTGTAARFYEPSGIASDGAGNLFVADTRNSAIRKIVLATAAVTTLPTGSGNFWSPFGIASDGAGSLYVADFSTTQMPTGAGVIRKVDVATSAVSTVVGASDRFGVALGALPASLSIAYGVAVLPTGELAIVDYFENSVLIGHL